MKLLSLVPADTKLKFIQYRKVAFAISGALAILSIILTAAVGLNFGIDFRGGTIIEIKNKTDEPIDLGDLRSVVGGLGLGDVELQEFGAPTDVLIRVEQQPGGDDVQQEVVSKIRDAIGETVEYRRVEVVGPKVSGELIREGTFAVILAIVAVLIYIWFRFEWQFAVGAVAALVHDVIITIGMFSLLQLEFNLSIIAALLTIVGYSLNDTVVVYDRVREKLRKYKSMPLPDLLDFAVNKTLSRTVLTSVTTLLALLSLYILGGEVIRGFTFAMIWGVLIGTYSSIFIAAPMLILLGVKRDWSKVGSTGAAGKSAGTG